MLLVLKKLIERIRCLKGDGQNLPSPLEESIEQTLCLELENYLQAFSEVDSEGRYIKKTITLDYCNTVYPEKNYYEEIHKNLIDSFLKVTAKLKEQGRNSRIIGEFLYKLQYDHNYAPYYVNDDRIRNEIIKLICELKFEEKKL